MADFADALRRLIEYVIGLIVAYRKGAADEKNKQTETSLEAYRQHQKDRLEIDGLSDDDLDRELRKPPH